MALFVATILVAGVLGWLVMDWLNRDNPTW